MDDLLFSSGDLAAALDEQAARMRQAVEAEREESLKQADAEEWAASLAHHFAVACPELKIDQISREPVQEVKVDVSGDRSRDFRAGSRLAYNYPGYRVIVHIPFDGDAGVFSLRPNQFNFNPPRGRVKGQDLLKTIEYAQDTKPAIDSEADEFINSANMWLAWSRGQIDSFNNSIEQQAGQAIEARRQRIEQRDAHLAESSIPVRSGEEEDKTYIPDVLIRRPAPSMPETRADDKPPELEPILEERVFEHILGVIRMQTRQMEQSPKTYSGMGEEDRRQTIVATLNTHYRGRATAEAFNLEGKTDILIRHEGRNLFICECKFWEGPEGFRKTIDQLFRYVGWRDTKLAIVMFVRQKGLTDILKKAMKTVEQHPQFIVWKAASETELRATMSWPGDKERHADLNVFFVHTPETETKT